MSPFTSLSWPSQTTTKRVSWEHFAGEAFDQVILSAGGLQAFEQNVIIEY